MHLPHLQHGVLGTSLGPPPDLYGPSQGRRSMRLAHPNYNQGSTLLLGVLQLLPNLHTELFGVGTPPECPYKEGSRVPMGG